MNGQTQLELFNCGLPQEKKYQNWSKKLVKYRVMNDSQLSLYLKEDKNYQINADMLAVFNFSDEPLLGKYYSVIFDCKRGIILSRKNTKQLIHKLVKEKLFLGITFQKHINEVLGFKYNHVISLWQVAYFSINGYCGENTDWVSFHQMTKYSCQKRKTDFHTKIVDGTKYKFLFDNCERNFSRRIAEGITHNSVFSKALIRTFDERGVHLHLCSQINNDVSLINNSDYLLPNHIDNYEKLHLKQTFDQVINHWHQHYGKCFAQAIDFPWQENDHSEIYSLAQRKKSIY